MNDILALGFDLERSGPTEKYKTFALGVSVVNSKKEVIDSLLVVTPIPPKEEFEESCWKFWSENIDVLEKLSKMVNVADEKELIEKFQEFRRKWEKESVERKISLDLVCDNTAFDAFFLNSLICHYTNDFPMPYTASHPQKYEDVFETTSMIRGFFISTIPNFTSTWGIAQKFRQEYGLTYGVEHDHNPVDDATVIALDYINLLGKRSI